MYGLFKAVIIPNESLKEHLHPYGYDPVNVTQYLWTHKDRDIKFSLVVNYFVIKYTKQQDSKHLNASLKANYEVIQDCTVIVY